MKKFILIGLFFYIGLSAQTDLTCNWDSLGLGVNTSVTEQSGNSVFIGFAGWSVKQTWADNWVYNLYLSKLNHLNVKYLFSVKGPDTPCYKEQEIDNYSLAKAVINLAETKKIDKLIIAAHSSGSFVAHQFFNILFKDKNFALSKNLTNKIYYFNLDGGIGSANCGVPIDSTLASGFARIFAVYAVNKSNGVFSPNKEDMEELTKMFPSNAMMLEMDVTNSNSTGKWSIHDALINKKPHNPISFNLEMDYNNIDTEHPVFDEYLNILLK